jgi:hypothetical protein
LLADGDQTWEAVRGKGAEEFVEPLACRRVADALLIDGDARAADSKADGVVDQQE